jgi:phage repressor protein C with HTH and peptisase S24 domain
MNSRERQENSARDWLKYLHTEWLYQFKEPAFIDYEPVRELIEQMEKCEDFGQIWSYKKRLETMHRSNTGDLTREPETLLKCAHAISKCKVYEEALDVYQSATRLLYVQDNYLHGVALWLSGTLEWLFAHKHDQALQDWQTGTDFLTQEARRYSQISLEPQGLKTDKGPWFADHLKNLEKAIRFGSMNNTIPAFYDVVLPSQDQNLILDTRRRIREVKQWLYRFERPKYSTRLNDIITTIERAKTTRTDEKLIWSKLYELDKLMRDPSEDIKNVLIAKIHVALKILDFDLFESARIFLIEVVQNYPKGTHFYGTALWALGYLEWLFDKEFARDNWQKAYSQYKKQSERSSGKQKEWYEERLKEMKAAMDQAKVETESSAAPDAEQDTAQAEEPSSETSPKYREASLRLYPVIGSIPAGGFAANPKAAEPITYLEANQVEINGEAHTIINLKTGRTLKLLSTHKHFVLQVTGNSMNTAKEVAILDGDYVLIRSQDTADPGDIVAVEIHGEDDEATLKRFSTRGNKVILSPESLDPSYQEFEFEPQEIGKQVHIRGIAVAVFKKA